MSGNPGASSSRDKQGTSQYSMFLPRFLDMLEEISERYLDEFDEHKAFLYLIAELFETTEEGTFSFTDGPNDGGIDFFITGNQSYSIYQCKCPAISTLEDSSSPHVFDKTPILELLSAIDFLRDPEGTYNIRRNLTRLRADYQRDLRADPDGTILTATLAIFGRLSPFAEKFFNASRDQLSAAGVHLNLITWDEIADATTVLDTPGEIDLSIDLRVDDVSKEVLPHRDYCYVLAFASDFYEAWRKYGWALFDWNVRLQLSRSKINRRIVASLSHAKTRKIFHHLNNGILITCRAYKIDRTRNRIRIEGPQIINGCQTVCAIRDAYEELPPVEQEQFRRQARVQVKIVRTVDPEFIGQMVITTNDQNPMNPRNLRSNTPEQKELQKLFDKIKPAWFYERKDGEWQSLSSSSSHPRWFRKSRYQFARGSGRPRYRVVDNSHLAKIWYSWIGNSDRVLKGGIRYFEDDTVYSFIFKRQLTTQFWDEFSAHEHFAAREELFSPGLPSPYQFLLAYTVAQFVRSRRIGWRRNRSEALQRGVKQGVLEIDPQSQAIVSPRDVVDKFLAEDDEYRFNVFLGNMSEIMIELFAFVLSRRYGPLNAQISRKLLAMKDIKLYVESAFHQDYSPNTVQEADQVFGPIYEYLKYVAFQYFLYYRAEIQAAPRLKAYLFQRKVVDRLRKYTADYDNRVTNMSLEWKPAGKPFLASLPDLPG